MINPGDIYARNGDRLLVRVDNINKGEAITINSEITRLTYLAIRTTKGSWCGTWEQEWFLKHFRPVTKLEKLLAGI